MKYQWNNFMVGVNKTWRTVLKGQNITKVENHCCKACQILLIFSKSQLCFINSCCFLFIYFYFVDFSHEFDYFLPFTVFCCCCCFVLFCFVLFFFETWFFCIALAVLELTLYTRLALNSEICLPLPPKY